MDHNVLLTVYMVCSEEKRKRQKETTRFWQCVMLRKTTRNKIPVFRYGIVGADLRVCPA